jgi:hypothetical protein
MTESPIENPSQKVPEHDKTPGGPRATASRAAEIPMSDVRLERRNDGRVWLLRPGVEAVPVMVRRPFPWTAPNRFLSLADSEENEILLIANPEDLDADSRKVLEAEAREIGFILEIESVDEIVTEYEIRNWKVRTRQGSCVFQTKRDEWPIPLRQGGYLIRSIDGNVFHVRELEELDEKSQKILWAYID